MDDLESELFDMGRRAEALAPTARGTEARKLLADAGDLLLRAASAHHGSEPGDLPVQEHTLGNAGIAGQLRSLGVKGILVTAAEAGEITDLRCAMPECFCAEGREHFDPRPPPVPPWAPTVDHHPVLKKDGGHLVLGNVRLAHVLCNREDYRINHLEHE